MEESQKLRTLGELIILRREWAQQAKRVIWTNGCFDLLHAGHIRSLQAAKALGDILVVGINSDSSVRANKGSLRPVMSEGDRAEVLSALCMVDYVTIFSERDPVAAITALRPDIHCKGADYADGMKPIPERKIIEQYGGEIRFIPLFEGRSTSALIAQIAAAYAEETCKA